jgi:hypothetical protein
MFVDGSFLHAHRLGRATGHEHYHTGKPGPWARPLHAARNSRHVPSSNILVLCALFLCPPSPLNYYLCKTKPAVTRRPLPFGVAGGGVDGEVGVGRWDGEVERGMMIV